MKTLTEVSVFTASFDLNVLCTPPAFILSQDQTLECFVSKPSIEVLNLNPSLIALYLFLSSISLRIVEFRSHTIHESLHVQCLYFPLVVQFSMTDFAAALFAEPDYYITVLSLCQEVFSKFFELFQVFSFPKPPARGQLAHYTTPFLICQYLFLNFFDFFEIFFTNF